MRRFRTRKPMVIGTAKTRTAAVKGKRSLIKAMGASRRSVKVTGSAKKGFALKARPISMA